MEVNDNAYCLNKRVAIGYIASTRAPTAIDSGNDYRQFGVEMVVSPYEGFIEEVPMQKWAITFVDNHGVQTVEHFDCEQKPDMEKAAQLIRTRFLPVPAELDLNDLEGRIEDPTLKSLKEQNSIQILSISLIS